MAATAYASLVSLLNTLDQIHTHPLVSTFFDINQNKSLSEKVNFFLDFVEKYSSGDSKEVEDLVRQIADAAHEAENIIEVHVGHRVTVSVPAGVGVSDWQIGKVQYIKKEVIKVKEQSRKSPSFLHNLQKIMKKMESIKEEVINFKVKTGKSRSSLPDLPPSSSSVAAPPATAEITTMVGFDDYAKKLYEDLTRDDMDQQIIAITGMGGIGKTTLAKNLFEDLRIKRRFTIRVWVTVSQESNARKVYTEALSFLEDGSIDISTYDDQQLSLQFHKKLFHRRYLIILDDVWSVEIWDKIKFYFPENNNGSRIVVTTREAKLVDYIGSSLLAINFLDEEYSWKLFCEKTFPQQGFPPELEEVGKKIVKKCGGLPLAIIVIGGLLVESPTTHENWERIAKDKSLILNTGENKPSSILHLSYKYLPIYLRPCFLYLGLYPEDYEIDGSRLTKLWVAEGFIKANVRQSLEEVAESYLNNLIDRNLLLHCPTSTPSWKRYYTHDLVRELCIKIGKQENFFCVQRSIEGNHLFIADQPTVRFYFKESHDSPSILRPIIVHREGTPTFKTRLLRVLCMDDEFPYYYELQEVSMRFLQDHHKEDYYTPPSLGYLLLPLLSQFWSLQTLILTGSTEVATLAEIWKMPQLRHIDISKFSLPDPPQIDDEICILQNLQTLKTIQNLILTEEVCERIPNIKELCIDYRFSHESKACSCYHLENLGGFKRLELLQIHCYLPELAGDSLQNIKFPTSLKELTLRNCKLEWNFIAVIASLPHLQFLSLAKNAVAAKEWNFSNEKFISLKRLSISHSDYLRKWIAQSSNFPVLEKLSIMYCLGLDEIPLDIGEIPTLEEILLWGCCRSANISALEILYEKERFGDLGLRLIIKSNEPDLLKEKIEELDLTSQNIEIVSFNDP